MNPETTISGIGLKSVFVKLENASVFKLPNFPGYGYDAQDFQAAQNTYANELDAKLASEIEFLVESDMPVSFQQYSGMVKRIQEEFLRTHNTRPGRIAADAFWNTAINFFEESVVGSDEKQRKEYIKDSIAHNGINAIQGGGGQSQMMFIVLMEQETNRQRVNFGFSYSNGIRQEIAMGVLRMIENSVCFELMSADAGIGQEELKQRTREETKRRMTEYAAKCGFSPDLVDQVYAGIKRS